LTLKNKLIEIVTFNFMKKVNKKLLKHKKSYLQDPTCKQKVLQKEWKSYIIWNIMTVFAQEPLLLKNCYIQL